jgi:hypothetical protein
MKRLILALFVTTLLTGCTGLMKSDIDSPTILSEQEVRELFVGNTVRSYNLNTKVNTWSYYREDGVLLQERFWQPRNGRWKIKSNGEICLTVKRTSCRLVGKVGERIYKYRLSGKGEREAIIRYRDFAKGNPLGL